MSKQKVYGKEYAASILDIFEDFLSEKGVEIENEDKCGDEGEAILYGEDFDNLMSQILGTLTAFSKELSKGGELDTDHWSSCSEIEEPDFEK
jgi:hypothetical protein